MPKTFEVYHTSESKLGNKQEGANFNPATTFSPLFCRRIPHAQAKKRRQKMAKTWSLDINLNVTDFSLSVNLVIWHWTFLKPDQI